MLCCARVAVRSSSRPPLRRSALRNKVITMQQQYQRTRLIHVAQGRALSQQFVLQDVPRVEAELVKVIERWCAV